MGSNVGEAQETTGNNDTPVGKEAVASGKPDERAAGGGACDIRLFQTTTLQGVSQK